MKTRLRRILPLVSGLTLVSLIHPSTVLAAAPAKACGPSVLGFLQFPTWYKYIIDNSKTTAAECVLQFDPITGIPRVLLAVFEILLRVGGLIAVVMIIYGGVLYMLSQGEPERTKGARTTIINALVGLAISLSAVAIVNLIGRNLL